MKTRLNSIPTLMGWAAFALTFALSSIEAAQITGGISFSGDYRAVNSADVVVANLGLADKIKFGPDGDIGPTTVTFGTIGDFNVIPLGAIVTMASPLEVNPVVLPVGALWSVGGFSLTISSLSQIYLPGPNVLLLEGVGIIHSTDPLLDDTPGTWVATFNTAGGTFSWSSSSGATCDCVISAFDCPPDATVQCDSDTSPAATGTPTVTSSGTCDPVAVSFTDGPRTAGTCPDNYSFVRTWTATPGCGAPQTCVQTIRVQDTTAPVISGVGRPRTIQCDEALVFDTPTVSDNCDPDPTLTFADVTTPGTCANAYSVTRTWTATDACGNTATASQTITVEDTTNPTISGVGVNATIQCPAIPAFSTPTAADTCGAATLTFVDVTTPGTCANAYSVTRTWTATDACGNTATASQIITVEDTTKPTISGVGVNATIQCPATPTFSTPTAADTCGAATLAFADVTTSGTCANAYSVTRTWTATDACGNTATASQTITVEDTTDPTISALPGPTTIQCPATPNFATPTASDTCGTATLTFVDSSSGTCPVVHVRTWTATDACGNTATASQTIKVADTTKPVITCAPNKQVQCDSTWYFDTPTATDACGTVNITVVSTVTDTVACVTTATRKWKATDQCGNFAECSQTVTMNCGTVCVPSSFNLEGSSALDGTDGNVRQFTVNGISVKVRAFSRTKGVGGTWAPAFLGQYGGGLGVTDDSEGDGGGDRHTVDNIDRDNYVLFEFSQPVVVKGANLGYVVTDSDLTLWIGSRDNPFNITTPLSDALLNSFYSEENLTALATARSASLNVGGVEGNVIIIAAQPGDTTPDDQFKIALLEICKRECPPPCTGSICGTVLRDCDDNGNLTGEAGLPGWTVTLKNGRSTVATTTTDSYGKYCFTGLAAGTYTVMVTPMADYKVNVPVNCNNQQTITLAACQNKTGVDFGYAGTKPGISLVVTGPSTAVCGQTITYTFTVKNTGNTCLYGGIVVNAPLLGGQVFHQTPVNPGQQYVFTKTYVVKTTDPKPLVLTATAIGDPPGSLANVSTTVYVSTTTTCGAQPPPCPPSVVAVPGNKLVKLTWLASSGATSYNVKRSTTKGGPYTTIKTGVTLLTYTDTTVVNGTVYYYVVSAVKSGAESGYCNEVCAIPSNGCPSPWNTKDIGTCDAGGGASWLSGKFTVIGSGADIWNTGDEFRYAYQLASGNCSIVAKVSSLHNTDPWAKAGVMIRETLTPGSKHAAMFLTPGNGAAFQCRTDTGGASLNVNTTGFAAPYWVKIVRSGNTFTAYRSPNGWNWTTMGSKTIYMGSTVYIGLGVTSHNDGVLCTATFDNVTATP